MKLTEDAYHVSQLQGMQYKLLEIVWPNIPLNGYNIWM